MSSLIESIHRLPIVDGAECYGSFVDRDEVLDLIRQHEGWQPIETAARDGTWILVRQTGVSEPSIVVCAFDPEWSEEGWWMCCDGKNPELPLRGPEPTHWMPLPLPPARKESQG